MQLSSHTPRDPSAPDIAADERTTVTGPHPVVRAVVGIGCGIAVGALAALLTPRPPTGRSPLRGGGA